MTKSIADNINSEKKRTRGRPKVDSTLLGLRLPPHTLEILDKSRGDLNRQDFIRNLIEALAKTP